MLAKAQLPGMHIAYALRAIKGTLLDDGKRALEMRPHPMRLPKSFADRRRSLLDRGKWIPVSTLILVPQSRVARQSIYTDASNFFESCAPH